ncbi:unnamed protein product [Phyllotreta striolata]|uniref:C-type lectin domain-containing protein n=1 Tax=Phyllotreta striolata TaxID=444603 RepID=A0A9N9XWJ6_PHYSR|nr:unnamed protein product [Phyllotreta striolata]
MSLKLHCLVIIGFLACLTAGKVGVQDDGKKDYFVVVEKQTFSGALEICKLKKNMQLAAINNEAENTDVLSNIGTLAEDFDRKFWTSGSKTSSGWEWKSNNKTIDWFDWGSGKPDDSADDGDCILVTVNHFDKGSWLKASCDEKHFVLCETALD